MAKKFMQTIYRRKLRIKFTPIVRLDPMARLIEAKEARK